MIVILKPGISKQDTVYQQVLNVVSKLPKVICREHEVQGRILFILRLSHQIDSDRIRFWSLRYCL